MGRWLVGTGDRRQPGGGGGGGDLFQKKELRQRPDNDDTEAALRRGDTTGPRWPAQSTDRIIFNAIGGGAYHSVLDSQNPGRSEGARQICEGGPSGCRTGRSADIFSRPAVHWRSPTMPEESITPLEQRRARLCRELATIGEMRSGSLVARCRRVAGAAARLREAPFFPRRLPPVPAPGPQPGLAQRAAGRRVVLGDGAPWIWNLAGEQFPGAMTRTPRRLADSAIPPRLRHNGSKAACRRAGGQPVQRPCPTGTRSGPSEPSSPSRSR